jgi:hypothetical protein
MNPPFDPSDLFLIAIMPAVRDMEIARMLGWYRIPLRSAPKLIEADFLAFYQTSAFGEGHRWQVEYAAPIRGHELTTRGQLFKDEPEHPRWNEEYYKIALGNVFLLPHPILADAWRRVTFLYTTGERILSAEKMKDLVTYDREREILWHALRERAETTGKYQVGNELSMEIDPAILSLLSGLEISERDSSPLDQP